MPWILLGALPQDPAGGTRPIGIKLTVFERGKVIDNHQSKALPYKERETPPRAVIFEAHLL